DRKPSLLGEAGPHEDLVAVEEADVLRRPLFARTQHDPGGRLPGDRERQREYCGATQQQPGRLSTHHEPPSPSETGRTLRRVQTRSQTHESSGGRVTHRPAEGEPPISYERVVAELLHG